MKIALIGEYSGFHLELSRGLEKLGHEAHVYSSGDKFKKIKSTHKWISESKGYLELAKTLFITQPNFLKTILDTYDVVQFINPDFVIAPNNFSRLYLNNLFRELKNSRAIKILAVVGCDSRVLPIFKKNSLSPCAGCLKELQRNICHYADESRIARSDLLASFVDIILPFGSAAYSAAYAHNSKNHQPLMFPIDIDKTSYKQNNLKSGKIVVMHGLNRAGFKGTKNISAVFNNLGKQYPEKFEFLLPDRLPFEDYINLVYRSNIIVDQLHSDAFGMNSLYSLATGRVVMTSHVKTTNTGGVNLSESPAIDVRDETSLEKALKEVSKWSNDDFHQRGKISREYVENYCAAEKIASQFIAVISTHRNQKMF